MTAKRQDERSVQDDLIELLRSHGLHVRALVGSMLQPGLPDMLLVSRHGRIMLVENKCWRLKRDPTGPACLAAQLDGPQRATILGELWRRKSYTWICSFIMVDGVCLEEAWITDGTGLWRRTFDALCKYWAEMT